MARRSSCRDLRPLAGRERLSHTAPRQRGINPLRVGLGNKGRGTAAHKYSSERSPPPAGRSCPPAQRCPADAVVRRAWECTLGVKVGRDTPAGAQAAGAGSRGQPEIGNRNRKLSPVFLPVFPPKDGSGAADGSPRSRSRVTSVAGTRSRSAWLGGRLAETCGRWLAASG